MIDISGRMTAWLLSAVEGRWNDIPSDRHAAIGAALRAALDSAPAAVRDKRLGETGCVVISQRALDEYLHQTQPTGGDRFAFQFERARRELTDLCLDAKRVAFGDREEPYERWRVRSRATGVDLSFSVARSGRLCVVASIGQLRVVG